MVDQDRSDTMRSAAVETRDEVHGPCGINTHRYRVWLIRYDDWRPRSWRAAPPRGLALGPADEQPMTAEQADAFVRSFNSKMLSAPKQIWAVAIKIRLAYEGDLEAGQVVTREMVQRAPLVAGR